MANNTNQLPDFQAYQLAFTKRVRAPKKNALPEAVSTARMAIYEDLIFNNLSESVSVCFPVAKAILGNDGWHDVMRGFFENHSSNSPLFREIPQEFLHFLSNSDCASTLNLPPFMLSLCHYEWIELSLSTQENTNDFDQIVQIDTDSSLLDNRIQFVSPMALLHYDYPVHKISPDNQPSDQLATQLLVYRDTEDDIQFIELNAITYELIRLLDQEKMTGEAAFTHIAALLKQENTSEITTFGTQILHDFYQQGVVVGLKKII